VRLPAVRVSRPPAGRCLEAYAPVFPFLPCRRLGEPDGLTRIRLYPDPPASDMARGPLPPQVPAARRRVKARRFPADGRASFRNRRSKTGPAAAAPVAGAPERPRYRGIGFCPGSGTGSGSRPRQGSRLACEKTLSEHGLTLPGARTRGLSATAPAQGRPGSQRAARPLAPDARKADPGARAFRGPRLPGLQEGPGPAPAGASG
jgi:hypothetical protein